MNKIVRVISACWLLPVVCMAIEERLPPEDEAGRDVSLVEFRQQLQKAISARNTQDFLALVDENVSVESQKGGDVKKFLEVWQPDSPASELWTTLNSIIQMGGGFVRSDDGIKFCAPYIFTNFPAELDRYGHGVVISDNAPLKSSPSKFAMPITNLSYNIVKVADWRSTADTVDNGMRWLKVKTLDGQEGYVEKAVIRSPSDYAACFMYKEPFGWKLISLYGNE